MLRVVLLLIVPLNFEASPQKDDPESYFNINPDDDVHLVYINNYTNVMHMKSKWVTFVFDSIADFSENSDFFNYSKVAKELKSQLFFTKINNALMSHVAQDYLTSVPGIILFCNQTAYNYNRGFTYEAIYGAIEPFASLDWKPPPTLLVYLNKNNFESIFQSIDYGILNIIGFEDQSRDNIYVGKLKTAAERLKQYNISIYIINNRTDPEIVSKLSVKQLGMMKLIRKSKLYSFKQDMQDKVSSIVKYSIEKKKFGSRLITDYKKGQYALQKHSTDDTGIFIGVIESKNSEWFQIFEETVNIYRDHFKFYHIFNKEVGKEFGCNQSDCLLTFYPERINCPYDEARLKEYFLQPEQLLDINKVKEYIDKTCRPLVGHYSNYINVMHIYQYVYPKAILYMDVEFEGYAFQENLYYIKQLRNVARDFKNITFAFSSRSDHEANVKDRGIEDTGNEVDLVIEDSDEYFYVMKEEFNYKNAKRFVSAYVLGTIRPVVKSDQIPKKRIDAYGIHILVGKTFDQFIFNTETDVIVFLYTEWCEMCKSLNLAFEKVAKKYEEHKKLQFAKMDVSNNLPGPEYAVRYYPTVYFGASNEKRKPKKLDTQKNVGVKELSTFIEDNWTVSKTISEAKSDL